MLDRLAFISRGLNGCCGGSFSEPFCSRAYRHAYIDTPTRRTPLWVHLCTAIDTVFMDPGHCRDTWIGWRWQRRAQS